MNTNESQVEWTSPVQSHPPQDSQIPNDHRAWIPPPAPDRHPVDEMGKRYAEGAGGLYAMMKMVAVHDQKRMLDMHAQRLCEDHRAQQIAAGFRDQEDGIDCPKMTAAQEGEDMGDNFSVTGDQYHYHVPTTVTNKNGSWMRYWPMIAGPLAGVLLALAIMAAWPNGSAPEMPEDTNTDTVVIPTVE